jgi:hypothetical protein
VANVLTSGPVKVKYEMLSISLESEKNIFNDQGLD